ncbi:MAG: metallophosphoesterase [Chloroflexota bacterium]|nr:metallophosphoesterase [Chloroflexota bacterium]
MRLAIFSDLHDNLDGLHRVLDDAAHLRADRLIYLGDAGRNPLIFAQLHQRAIACTFGNWEVSGLRRLSPSLAAWVGAWPAFLQVDDAIFCHATPNMPAAATTTAAAVHYVAGGVGWSTLFPRLNHNDEARWNALAALETANLRVAFHGHTHVQQVWVCQEDGNGRRHLRAFSEPDEFRLETGLPAAPTRYLIGVGSAGQPDDGPALGYAIYDDVTKVVTLRRLA